MTHRKALTAHAHCKTSWQSDSFLGTGSADVVDLIKLRAARLPDGNLLNKLLCSLKRRFNRSSCLANVRPTATKTYCAHCLRGTVDTGTNVTLTTSITSVSRVRPSPGLPCLFGAGMTVHTLLLYRKRQIVSRNSQIALGRLCSSS